VDGSSQSTVEGGEATPGSAARRRGPRHRLFQLGVIAALLLGARWFLAQVFDVTLIQAELLAAAGVLAVVPWTGKFVVRLLDRARHPRLPARLAIAAVIWAAGSCYLSWTAHAQNRSLLPLVQDEYSYEIQARMVAEGRLWFPPHPMAEFFEACQMLARPVYASIYFPGTALLYWPMATFRLEPWVLPVCASGGCLALLYLITASAIDGVAGLLAALLLAAVREFRILSVMQLSQIPVIVFGLACIALWLAWRRHRRPGWLVAIGMAMGWAAITRPVDALAFALPVALAMASDLRGSRIGVWARVALLISIGLAPFLALQLAFDRGTTGRVLLTPYTLYFHHALPGLEYGFHRDEPPPRQFSKLPEKETEFEDFRRVAKPLTWARMGRLPGVAARRAARAVDDSLPTELLLIFIPLAPLGLTGVRRWVVAGVAPLFVLLYLANPLFLNHYSVAIAPIIAFWICLGGAALGAFARGLRRGAALGRFVPLAVAALAISSLPEVRGTRGGTGDFLIYPPPGVADAVQAALAPIPGRAVVLFHYHSGDDEPIYNANVAWPDDARVIRANDLGPDADAKLVDYYAACQPDRVVYLYDPHALKPLHKLGPMTRAADVLRELRRCTGERRMGRR
jgi:hypothetical protein